ncbi:MAG: hypothetical protein AAF360_08500 [Pseudomonadota bacterium]
MTVTTMTRVSRIGGAISGALFGLANAYWAARTDARRRNMSDAELAVHFLTREQIEAR